MYCFRVLETGGLTVRSCVAESLAGALKAGCTEAGGVSTCNCDTKLCNSAIQQGFNVLFAAIAAFALMYFA